MTLVAGLVSEIGRTLLLQLAQVGFALVGHDFQKAGDLTVRCGSCEAACQCNSFADVRENIFRHACFLATDINCLKQPM